MRKTFCDIFKEQKIDINREYSRLYEAFYESTFPTFSVSEMIDYDFDCIWFKDTCQSLQDFNEEHNINFEKQPQDFSLDYLIFFCEYIYNFISAIKTSNSSFNNRDYNKIERHIYSLIEKLGLKIITKNNFFLFVEESPQVKLVAELVPDTLSNRILEYNHHSTKGNLDSKKSILLKIAEELEPQRKDLKAIDTALEKNLFIAFNNFNIRHNNCNSKDASLYVSEFANLIHKEKEKLYDWIYNQSMIAFIKLNNIDNNKLFKDIKEKIDNKKS